MPTRRSPAQIRSQLRQAQSRARQNQQKVNQAIRNCNRQVDKVNASRRRFVNDYNAAVRQYDRSVDAFTGGRSGAPLTRDRTARDLSRSCEGSIERRP